MRCAALVGANPAKLARPRRADVFPVAISAPVNRLVSEREPVASFATFHGF